jgi:FkbM family methyltransferase
MPDVDTFQGFRRLKRRLDAWGVTEMPLVRTVSEQIKRRCYGQFYDDAAEVVEITVRGMRLSVPRRFVEHFVFQEYEPVTTAALLRVLRPGMNVADVGAHIGYYSVLAARAVCRQGTVHSIEPAEENGAFIETNARLNRLPNIRLHRCAAAAERGARAFHLTGSSDSHGFYSHPLAETRETVETLAVPLDELVPAPLHVVKIDVEGAEIEVLRGMERHLSSGAMKALCVEWNPSCQRHAGHDPQALPEYLSDLGFQEVTILDDERRSVRPLAEVRAEVAANEPSNLWYVNLWAEKG